MKPSISLETMVFKMENMHSVVYKVVKGVLYLLHSFGQHNAVQTQSYSYTKSL